MEKHYEILKNKYSLPTFEELANHYELDELENKKHLLRNIRGKMKERFDAIISLLLEILEPEADAVSIHEAQIFSENDSKQILVLFDKIKYFSRSSSVLFIDDSEEKNADYIKQIHKKYLILKPQIKEIIERIRDSWNGLKKQKHKEEYFG
jgi:hypothetical protein